MSWCLINGTQIVRHMIKITNIVSIIATYLAVASPDNPFVSAYPHL